MIWSWMTIVMLLMSAVPPIVCVTGVVSHAIILPCAPKLRPTGDLDSFVNEARWEGPSVKFEGWNMSTSDNRIYVSFNNITLEYNLVISSLTYSDSGDYKCKLGKWGEEVYLLTVVNNIGQPIITSTIDGNIIEGIENQSMIITCIAADAKSYTMSLSRNGKKIPLKVENIIGENGTKFIQGVYMFQPIRNWHLSIFVCTVSSETPLTILTVIAVLHLKLAPIEIELSPLRMAKEGTYINMSCNATGSLPEANITWQYPSGLAPQIQGFSKSVLGFYTSVSSISFLANRQYHSKQVQCIVKHDALVNRVIIIRLVVVGFGPDQVTIIGGYTENRTLLTLTCISSRMYPDAHFEWEATQDELEKLPLPVNTLTSNHTVSDGSLISSQTIVLDLAEFSKINVVSCRGANVIYSKTVETKFELLSQHSSDTANVCHIWIVVGVLLAILLIVVIIFLVYVNRRKIKFRKSFSQKSKKFDLVQRPSGAKTQVSLAQSITSIDNYYLTILPDNNDATYENTDIHRKVSLNDYNNIGDTETSDYQVFNEEHHDPADIDSRTCADSGDNFKNEYENE